MGSEVRLVVLVSPCKSLVSRPTLATDIVVDCVIGRDWAWWVSKVVAVDAAVTVVEVPLGQALIEG